MGLNFSTMAVVAIDAAKGPSNEQPILTRRRRGCCKRTRGTRGKPAAAAAAAQDKKLSKPSSAEELHALLPDPDHAPEGAVGAQDERSPDLVQSLSGSVFQSAHTSGFRRRGNVSGKPPVGTRPRERTSSGQLDGIAMTATRTRSRLRSGSDTLVADSDSDGSDGSTMSVRQKAAVKLLQQT